MRTTTTPARAVRARCLDCAAGEKTAVRECQINDCALHQFRRGRGMKGKGGSLKPIRAYCLRCMSGQQGEVRACPSDQCDLYVFRMGRRPTRTASPSPESRPTGPIARGFTGAMGKGAGPEDDRQMGLLRDDFRSAAP